MAASGASPTQVSSERRVEMKKFLRVFAWSLPLVALLVLFFIWPRIHEDRPECPHDYPEAYPTTLISDKITNVPEYHDCQRFLVKDDHGGLKYDSLEAIFVRYKLDTLYRNHMRNPDARLQGGVSASTEFEPQGLLVVGQVLSYGDYAPLGIKTGSDCLVLSWN